jgi:hypothetical protein
MLIAVAPIQACGQSAPMPDSTRMHAIMAYLDTAKRESPTLYPIHTLLNGFYINDSMTFLVAHAKAFDFFLQCKLDLSFSPVGKSFKIYSVDMPPEMISDEFRQEMATMHERLRLWNILIHFLEIKEPYERWIKMKFYTSDASTAQLEADVAKVVQYGGLAFPKTVQSILLLKYRHLKRRKIEEEMSKGRN